MPEIVLTEQFLDEFRLLPRNLTQKCMRLISEIRSAGGPLLGDNFSPGWRIHSLRNSSYLSASLDMNFRVLLRRVGATFMLCRVLKHDDAYRPNVLAAADGSSPLGVSSHPMLPRELHEALLALGIPSSEIRPLADISDEDSLSEALLQVPPRIAELALRLYEEDLLLFQKTRYRSLSGSKGLLDLLRGPLGEWETYLHPTQAYIVDLPTSLFTAVEGPAGTGKTVCALHRVLRLLQSGIRVRIGCTNEHTLDLLSSLLRSSHQGMQNTPLTTFLPLRGGRASLLRFLAEPQITEQDHIILDECQDLSAAWLDEGLVGANPAGVTLFYDWNQAAVTWNSGTIDRNMKAARTEWRDFFSMRSALRLSLSINYRNSLSIASFVETRYGHHLPDYFAPEISLFDAGPVVELKAHRDAMGATLIIVLKKLLQEFACEDIGIIDMGYGLGTGRQTQASMFDRFKTLALEIQRGDVQVISIRGAPKTAEAIAWGFPHEFKGFERKAVVMVLDKNIARAQTGNVRAMMYHYMAATRARDRLVILREEAVEPQSGDTDLTVG